MAWFLVPVLRSNAAAVGVSPWPDATNTGYRNAPGYPGSLTAGGAIASNTTYNFKDYTAGIFMGSLGSPLSNVTFNGCRFTASGSSGINVALFGDNFTFNYCSFEPDTVSAPPVTFAQGYQFAICANGGFNSFVQKLTVTRCDMWGWGNAIDAYGSTQAKPHTFTSNWIHDARADGGIDHTDGIGSLNGGDGAYVVLNNNTISSVGNTNGIAYQGTSNTTPYDHFTVTNNLFSGFNQTIALNLSPAASFGTPSVAATNTVFTDNTFSTLFKPIDTPLRGNDFWTNAATGGLWRRNKWLVPVGAAWGNPSNSGKFWMPVSSSIIGTDDTPYVSAADFTG